jgi:hypothetical protein
MNGNCGEDVGPKGEIGLILRGEDERITNRLAVTSLLYRFKVSLIPSMVPREEIGLILRGEDERITNRLAVTSLLYRFKVSLISSLWSQGKDIWMSSDFVVNPVLTQIIRHFCKTYDMWAPILSSHVCISAQWCLLGCLNISLFI